jgi:hypothetical protein
MNFKRPYPGETRVITKFALFPITCNIMLNGEYKYNDGFVERRTIWFEFVRIKQKYRSTSLSTYHGGEFGYKWRNVAFLF